MLPLRSLTSLTSALFLAAPLAGCTESATPDPEPAAIAVDAAAVTPARTGADIVNQHCLICHGRGLYNAPKIGDADAWRPKLAEGRDHLWQVLLHGEKAMPPRGNCPDCSDAELRAAMDYLIEQALPAAAETETTAVAAPKP